MVVLTQTVTKSSTPKMLALPLLVSKNSKVAQIPMAIRSLTLKTLAQQLLVS
jgi:hypothetical protein